MTDRQAFKTLLRETPDDASTRMVYADWLQENSFEVEAALQRVIADPASDDMRLAYADAVESVDPDRAEFIRVQVELARTPQYFQRESKHKLLDQVSPGQYRVDSNLPSATSVRFTMAGSELTAKYEELNPAWLLLNNRSQQLLRGLYEDSSPTWKWIGCCRGLIPKDGTWRYWHDHVHFNRGFVSRVSCDPADWFAVGDLLRESHPVTDVSLTTSPRYAWNWPDHTDSRRVLLRLQEDPELRWFPFKKVCEVAGCDENDSTESLYYGGASWSEGFLWIKQALLKLRFPGVSFEVSLDGLATS